MPRYPSAGNDVAYATPLLDVCVCSLGDDDDGHGDDDRAGDRSDDADDDEAHAIHCLRSQLVWKALSRCVTPTPRLHSPAQSCHRRG